MNAVDSLTVSSPRVPLPSLCRVVTLLAFTSVLSSFAQTQSGSPNPRPPWVVVDAPPPSRYDNLLSPQILVLADGTYLATYDHSGHYSGAYGTYVCRSADRGATWERVAKVDSARSVTLFELEGRLYMLGVEIPMSGSAGRPFVLASSDRASTWTVARDEATGFIRGDAQLSTSSGSIVVHEGRLWVPFFRRFFREGDMRTHAFVASAGVTSDLCAASSWRWSEEIATDRAGYDVALHATSDGLELRVLGGSKILARGRVSNGGWNLRQLREPPVEERLPERLRSKVVHAVGSDAELGALTQPPSPLSDDGERPFGHTLAWSTSVDGMKTWTHRTLLLHEPDSKGAVFGWSQWALDGDDLLVVSCAWLREGADAERPRFRRALVFLRVPRIQERVPRTPPLWGPLFDPPAASESTTQPLEPK